MRLVVLWLVAFHAASGPGRLGASTAAWPSAYMLNIIYVLYTFVYNYIYSPALALEGFLLAIYRIMSEFHDFSSPPTCRDLPRLA